jgi:hypothetical protein
MPPLPSFYHIFPLPTNYRYDRLQSLLPRRADREYVRLLHLAAGHGDERGGDGARALAGSKKSARAVEAVRDLLGLSGSGTPPPLTAPALDLTPYDRLLPSARRSHAERRLLIVMTNCAVN